MANERYTRTNQKLYFAGVSLDFWRKAEAGKAMNWQAQVQAEREACLFHLYGAVLGLCHEIAGYYRLPQADAGTVEQLLSTERLAASPSPEMAELVELAQQPETWLAKLLSSYHALFLPPREAVQAKPDVTLPLITAVTLEDEVQPVSADELEFCRQQLKELALRFRSTLSEW